MVGAAAQATAPQANNQWRYRQHNGQWWYWMPSNRWVVWNGSQWNNYTPGAYSVVRPGARVYRSYGPNYGRGNYGNGSWGQWGPVYYNRYGQRQYPYSQRTSGLQQLGPVPAMGGVRSLPGWGGER